MTYGIVYPSEFSASYLLDEFERHLKGTPEKEWKLEDIRVELLERLWIKEARRCS
jgi:hypothetical protein